MDKIKCSIIIPVYNEEGAVLGVIEEVKAVVVGLGIEYEIIAVNDCSKDGSGKIIDQIDGIKVIHHTVNKGYGASLKTGIKESKYDWIIISDADGTYPIKEIPNLVKYIDEYDLVVGARVKEGSAIPFERKFAKKFLNSFAGYLAGRKIPDLNSGLRIFNKNIVYKYWGLFPERFSFTSTLTMISLTRGYETKFVPIGYDKREGKSSIKPADFFKFLRLVLKLSLFFRPLKVFFPISLMILLLAALIPVLFFVGVTDLFLDTTFIVLCATALQTFFFGLLAEIVIYNK
ncbi:MAG: glycosyltransferase family 2 protein [Patescibacteria group bacterium]|nr:glycosyltransferase family 2 protein [Patescibacteria group bacterium]